MDSKSKIFRSLGKAYYKFITNLLQQENWQIQEDQQEDVEQDQKLKFDKKSEKSLFKPVEENLETIVKSRQDEFISPIQKKKTIKPIILSIESSEDEDLYTCKDCNINFSNKTDLDRHNQAHNIQFELDEEYQ